MRKYAINMAFVTAVIAVLCGTNANGNEIKPIVLPEEKEWTLIEPDDVFGGRDPFVLKTELPDKMDASLVADEFAPERAARLQSAIANVMGQLKYSMEGVMVFGEESAYVVLSNEYYEIGEVLEKLKVEGFTAQLTGVALDSIEVTIEADGSDVNMIGESRKINYTLEF